MYSIPNFKLFSHNSSYCLSYRFGVSPQLPFTSIYYSLHHSHHKRRQIYEHIWKTNSFYFRQYFSVKVSRLWAVTRSRSVLSDKRLPVSCRTPAEQSGAERTHLCRSFDQLSHGQDYSDVKPVIHIAFLDYSLFPEKPEFCATYRLMNEIIIWFTAEILP